MIFMLNIIIINWYLLFLQANTPSSNTFFKQLSQICSFVIDFGTAIAADEGHLPAKPGETRLQLPGVKEEGWREPDY